MEQDKATLSVPMAIVIAGVVIAGSIFFSRSNANAVNPFEVQNDDSKAASIDGQITFRPVDSTDHILGNPDADIMILEYSDLECPFCKSFHKTMLSLLDQYGKKSQVAWAYRHFPLDIHPKSPKESEAAECAYELGGNDKFWAFINHVFEITPANNGLDAARLPGLAADVGLDPAKFSSCLNSGKYATKVQADYNDGIGAGVSGTPNIILIVKKELSPLAEEKLAGMNKKILGQMQPGSPNLITLDSSRKKVSIGGAFTLPMMKEIVDLLLK